MADFLKNNGVEKIDLKQGSGGVFDVYQDGVLLFSKSKAHRFPEDAEVIDLIKRKQNS